MNPRPSLRRVVKDTTKQDIARCLGCSECNVDIPEQDIPLGSLIQLALMDDDEALQSRTLWSDPVMEASRGACKRGLNLQAVILALRDESKRRAG
jgi:hypothetical protein